MDDINSEKMEITRGGSHVYSKDGKFISSTNPEEMKEKLAAIKPSKEAEKTETE